MGPKRLSRVSPPPKPSKKPRNLSPDSVSDVEIVVAEKEKDRVVDEGPRPPNVSFCFEIGVKYD